jgi:natural product precursor
MKKISLKDIKNALKRDEMRIIFGGGCGNGSGSSTGGGAPCPTWPGCFQDCDCQSGHPYAYCASFACGLNQSYRACNFA